MRSALLLPSQNALDQLSRFPRPSQERINYLVQEFRQQISNLMSLLVALRKVDLTHAVHCGITDEPQRIGHWLERIRKVQRFDSGIERSLSRCAGKVIDQALEPDAKQSTSCSRGNSPTLAPSSTSRIACERKSTRFSSASLSPARSKTRRCSDESCHRNIQTLHPRLLTVDQPDDLHHEGAT